MPNVRILRSVVLEEYKRTEKKKNSLIFSEDILVARRFGVW